MQPSPVVELYAGELDELLPLFLMSTGLDSEAAVRRLIAVERTRGTLYYTAVVDSEVVGLIGVWFDPTGEVAELEPPQVIDMAVAPEHRRRGVGRMLMDAAIQATRGAGYDRLWLYMDGHNTGVLSFYYACGFQLVSVVPDWFGPGSAKAILRLDFDTE